MDWWTTCTVLHLLGLAVGLGAATVKTVLVLVARTDRDMLAHLVVVARPITTLIISGLVLLTGSGIGWMVLGVQLDRMLAVKLGLVAVLWVLGPVIDKVIEPKLFELVRAGPAADAAALETARSRHMVIELLATGIFYIIAVIGALL